MGNIWASMLQMYPPRSNFSTDQMPDLTGQVMIVTGGNSGIGFENVKALLQHNARVYLAARSKEKAEAAIKDLSAQTGKEAIFLELDIGDLASVRRSAREFLSKEKELHVLFNNAGVMIPPVELVTKDGFDLQFGTNVIGPFLFTELLMPALFAATESAPDHHARVITVSSSAAYFFTVNWDSFIDGPARRQMTTHRLSQQRKFASVVVARQIAKRYADKGVISISLIPGNIITDCQRYIHSLQRGIARAVMGYMPPLGALTQLWAGTMPEALNHNGENGNFLFPGRESGDAGRRLTTTSSAKSCGPGWKRRSKTRNRSIISRLDLWSNGADALRLLIASLTPQHRKQGLYSDNQPQTLSVDWSNS